MRTLDGRQRAASHAQDWSERRTLGKGACRGSPGSFARNSREWQQLVEVCRLIDTLLIELDVVYRIRRTAYREKWGQNGGKIGYTSPMFERYYAND